MKMQPRQATLCLLLLVEFLAAPKCSGDTTFECLLNGKGPAKKGSEIIIEDKCNNTSHTITPRNCNKEEATINTPITCNSFSTSASRSSSNTSCSPAFTTATYITTTTCSGYTNVVTTTTVYTTTFSPIITTSCSPVVESRSATTLHGVYMTVLLVMVAVTITMTTLVVYMCLMMRRAKSGRVPQTTTGTTHTNNMAASDYCDPISLTHFRNTNGEPMYTEPVDTLQQMHQHNCRGTKLESAASQEAECLNNSCYGFDQSDHPTHPPLPQPPTSDNVYNATYQPTSPGSHEYEIVDELRKNDRGKTTGEVHIAVEGVEREKDKKEKKEKKEKQEEEEEEKEELDMEEEEEEEGKKKEEKEVKNKDKEDNGTTEKTLD